MKTEVLQPTIENIAKCAELIKRGEVVAFPTETVYGLGCSAFNEESVKKIYWAKGRPSDNPLIVHVCSKEQIKEIVTDIPEKAKLIISNFMPGAVTLVLNKKPHISKVVTGGLETVAVRMPSNKIALSLIEKSGVPICAPSANISSSPSPTTAQDVFDDMDGKIQYILDGGQCEIGLESTVLDFSSNSPRLLRNGGLTIEQIEKVIGKIEINKNNSVAICPGMKYKHYAPKANVYFADYNSEMYINIINLYDKLILDGKNPIIFAVSTSKSIYGERQIMDMGKTNNDYAKNLFMFLRQADKDGYDTILAEGVERAGIGATIINRLVKSSGGQII